MNSSSFRISIVCALLTVCSCSGENNVASTADAGVEPAAVTAWLIEGATLYHGDGGPGVLGDLRIVDGMITEIGDLTPVDEETVWQAQGLALAPGFIDPHSHHVDDLSPNMASESVLAQGITTVVGGADGFSNRPVVETFADFEAAPAAFNIALYGGHNTYRTTVMGEDYKRGARPEEIQRMRALLAADLEAGALGLSTGLEYEPGLYAETAEIVVLAKDTAAKGGRYSSHIRSEDIALFAAVDEFIEIARQAGIPAHYSHMKVAMSGSWGRSREILERLDAARENEGVQITGDVYPYNGWQSTMQVLLPERDIHDRAAYEFALSEIANPEDIIFSRYSPEPSVVGKTLADVAVEQDRDPVDILMEMVQRAVAENGRELIIGRNIGEEDIRNFISWPHASITSDGGVDDRHPRGQGAFPRAIRLYVREFGLVSLGEMIHKMTGHTADLLGLTDRGRLDVGLAADIVLFDPETITDNGSFNNPVVYSTGIEAVWVNGELVWHDNAPTEARSGRALRRSD